MLFGQIIGTILCIVLFLFGVCTFIDDKSLTKPDLLGENIKLECRTVYARGMGICLMAAAVDTFLLNVWTGIQHQPLLGNLLKCFFIIIIIAAAILNIVCRKK